MDDGKPSSHPPMVGGEDDMDVGDCSEEGEEEDEEEEEIEMGSSPLEDHGTLMMALASSNGKEHYCFVLRVWKSIQNEYMIGM